MIGGIERISQTSRARYKGGPQRNYHGDHEARNDWQLDRPWHVMGPVEEEEAGKSRTDDDPLQVGNDPLLHCLPLAANRTEPPVGLSWTLLYAAA